MEELMNLHFTNNWWAVGVPIILMILDILTGYYNAWKNEEVSSSKMRDGLGKKCAELCYIIVRFFV
jgi:toxin secretion/phage lysis holin